MNKFEECRRILEFSLVDRFSVRFTPFEGPNPGTSFDFDSGNVAVHGALWSNLSFDFEAVALSLGTTVVAESVRVDGPDELKRLLDLIIVKVVPA